MNLRNYYTDEDTNEISSIFTDLLGKIIYLENIMKHMSDDEFEKFKNEVITSFE